MYFIPDSPDISFIELPEHETIYTYRQNCWSSEYFICFRLQEGYSTQESEKDPIKAKQCCHF